MFSTYSRERVLGGNTGLEREEKGGERGQIQGRKPAHVYSFVNERGIISLTCSKWCMYYDMNTELHIWPVAGSDLRRSACMLRVLTGCDCKLKALWGRVYTFDQYLQVYMRCLSAHVKRNRARCAFADIYTCQ